MLRTAASARVSGQTAAPSLVIMLRAARHRSDSGASQVLGRAELYTGSDLGNFLAIHQRGPIVWAAMGGTRSASTSTRDGDTGGRRTSPQMDVAPK